MITEEQQQVVHRSVEHLHGPKEVPYEKDELVVLCLVRNGRPYVRSFVEHYSSLGVKHLVFLDNGSTDGTVEALKAYDNVSVLRTLLLFKEYKNLMRQYLIERFGRKGRWTLSVDIDELFDYPYSDVIGLGSFLGYLNGNSYTAVVGQMLDMFPEEPLSTGSALEDDVPLKERHRFYDVSNIKGINIKGHPRFRNNTLDSDEIEFFSWGIRHTVFGARSNLTKLPLIFLDDRVKRMDDSSHWVDDAKIADLTCVLFHYKFLDGHLHQQAAQAVREENYWNNSVQYKRYLEVLDSTQSLQVKQETSKELGGVNELLEEGFLVVSEDYISWVDAEEEKSVLEAAAAGGWGEARKQGEAYLGFRKQERAKTLKMQRLGQQLREERRRKLLEARQNRRLTRQVQRQTRQVHNLTQRLGTMQDTRTWKLMKVLHRVKARALSLGMGRDPS